MTDDALRIEDTSNGTGDSIEWIVYNDVAHIEIDNPWAGDSERGFGRTTSVRLTKEQAALLRDALDRWVRA